MKARPKESGGGPVVRQEVVAEAGWQWRRWWRPWCEAAGAEAGVMVAARGGYAFSSEDYLAKAARQPARTTLV